MHRRFHTALHVTVLATSVTLLNSRIARGQIAFDVPTDCGSRELFEANIRARVGEREAKAILDVLALRIRGQVGTYVDDASG